ncbi:MAG: CDP-diacylglycerol--glycerol-3-phosphate 3-phosphatidyltransferase [Planctomycetaceae bacterium]|nr:CDP-diacylglycerol--glycerol-3-phosphate 3-phosphatidyltransferase [Planctomycetaceae bacterium]
MPPLAKQLWNLPNQLTLLRLVLAVVVFVLLQWRLYGPALVLFVIAASTDWLDGYLARRWGLITQLGRILDPFADKIIICGTFIFLAAEPASLLPAWVVVVVVGRELLVTALRSFLEQQEADFSASMSGKLKMAAQCLAVVSCIALLWLGSETWPWLPNLVRAAVAATALLTIISGVSYVVAAWRLLSRSN